MNDRHPARRSQEEALAHARSVLPVLGASTRSRVKPFLVMDMLRAANELEQTGTRVVHMEAGQPSGPAPRRAIEAAQALLDAGPIGYTEATGIPPLRERIARYYRERHGVEVSPERVIVTTGSSGAFILSFLAAFEIGARVALAVPGYPAYRNILASLGIDVVDIRTGPENRWTPTADDIAALARVDGLNGVLVASPANPTGTMVAPEALAELVSATADHNAWFISDEIYHGLTYGMPEATALAYDDNAIIINSFSKYYCMTGWRIGWMVVPECLVRTVECLAQNLFISPPALSQVAALAAFDTTDELEARRQRYAENRAFLLEALPRLGFTEFTPVDGAFYIYTNVSRFSNDSLSFARSMLDEIGVATTPGADFDAADGHRWLRMSFAGSLDDMHEAVRRLETWLG